MRWVTVGVLGAAAAALGAFLWSGRALAQSEADNRTQLPLRFTPAPQPVSQRPNMFAAASAASARRLSPEQRDEWRFLKQAAASSRFESDASRLALAKSKDAAVRAFATSMIEHHTSMANMLDHMLHVRSMAAPMLGNDQRKVLNRLSKLQGRKFDQEYVSEVALRSQQESLLLFERAAVSVQEPALKAWIDRTLPTLQNQLASAERITVPGDGYSRSAKTGVHVPGARVTARNNP